VCLLLLIRNNLKIGKKVAQLSKGLGMKVLIAGRKGQKETTKKGDIERTPFEDVLKRSTVLVIAVPRVPETMNLISTAEFQAMSQNTVLINISRGGIVDEAALLQALKEKSIFGAATDVFGSEPASAETSPLLAEDTRNLNLTTSPHLAWYANKTMKNYLTISPSNVHNFLLGKPTNLV
jgi:lactate dehydrogenase-like 2-hydroxyacid dehydrogenase